jgi:hypothetical protein
MTPTVEQVARTDTGLASLLRVSVARLSRRLRSERDPDNELLPVGQLSVLGSLFRNGPLTVGQLAGIERVQPPSMTRTVNCLVDGGYVAPVAAVGRRRATRPGGRPRAAAGRPSPDAGPLPALADRDERFLSPRHNSVRDRGPASPDARTS